MLIQSGRGTTSSLIYLVLPMIMGLLVKRGVLSMNAATWIFPFRSLPWRSSSALHTLQFGSVDFGHQP